MLPGESIGLDTGARIPLRQAGFYRQRVRAFALDGTHLYAWLDGDRNPPRRPSTNALPADHLLRHALDTFVEPGGRLLVSRYAPTGGTDRTDVAAIVERLGFPVAGVSHAKATRETSSTAWVDPATNLAEHEHQPTTEPTTECLNPRAARADSECLTRTGDRIPKGVRPQATGTAPRA